ncbi:hypothetical protein ABPG74_014678 [Tetrahymena malaccensis]
MNFMKVDNNLSQGPDNTFFHYHKDILTNQYICFNQQCDSNNIITRMCHQLHPLYVLPKTHIKAQLATQNIYQGQYDSMMGILYQTISIIQELQKVIDAFYYFPKLQEDQIEYQQNMFNKLKSHFQLIQNQGKYWLVIKNQQQQFIQIDRFLSQAKEQIYRFECQFFNFRQMTNHQGLFLELNQDYVMDNNFYNKIQSHKKQNDSQNCIQIDDQSSDDDIQIIEKSDFQQSIEEEGEVINQSKALIEINSQNQSNNDQVVELSSGEDNIQKHIQDFKQTYQFHNMIDEKLDQQKLKNFLQIQQNSAQQTNQQNYTQQTILCSNQKLPGQTSNQSQNDQSYKNIIQQIQNKKIKKSKKEPTKENDLSNSQDKILKQRKKRKTQDQEIQELQKKLSGNLNQIKSNSPLLSELNLQNQSESVEISQNQKSITIPLKFNQSLSSATTSKLTTSSDETTKNNISQEVNVNQQQQLDSLKTTQLMTTSSSNSENSNMNEKIIEDDDELEQELQIIKKQNGSVEKIMVTQYSWQLKSSEKKRSFDSNEEEYSRTPLIDQLKIPSTDKNQEIIIAKNENYLAQFKVIYFKNQKALLALNNKNLILYTFQKPRVRKSPQFDQYNIDSDEENIESKSQQEVDYNFLYKKKILYNNIKSAEVFEVFGSYFVLVMFETSGFVSVVKSNNLIKWKPYYRSVEPSIQANYYIFSNSTTLQMILFYSSQIKLVQLDINSSKPNAKQATSRFLQQSLLENSFSTACQGIWQLKRDENQAAECKYSLYFTILQENQLLLFRYDSQKIDLLAKEYIQNILACKLIKINDQINIVAIMQNEIQLYNLQIKLHTRIQANPEFGIIVDVSLPQDQKQNEQTILIVQENGSFQYNLQKNKSNILNIPEKYNSIYHSQNLNSLITLKEQENGSFQVNLNPINQIQN